MSEKTSSGLAAEDVGILAGEYLRPEEVAAMLQVCEKTLTRWARADPTLPVLKIAGTTRYPRERLLRWLRAREQGQPSRNPLRPERNGASGKATA